jgi:hypothetical protein
VPQTSQTFEIRLSRLARVGTGPGLIRATVRGTSKKELASIGVLTDAALRGRLAHFNAHSANEISAIRQELAKDAGEATTFEKWAGLERCVQFWLGFSGSRIRALAWSCDRCGASDRENVAGTSGESFPRRCRCGQVNRITVPK